MAVLPLTRIGCCTAEVHSRVHSRRCGFRALAPGEAAVRRQNGPAADLRGSTGALRRRHSVSAVAIGPLAKDPYLLNSPGAAIAPSPPALRRPHQRSAPNARAPAFAPNRIPLKRNQRRRPAAAQAAPAGRSDRGSLCWGSASLGSSRRAAQAAPAGRSDRGSLCRRNASLGSASHARDVCAIKVYAVVPSTQLFEPGCCRTPPPSSRRQHRALARAHARIRRERVNAGDP